MAWRERVVHCVAVVLVACSGSAESSTSDEPIADTAVSPDDTGNPLLDSGGVEEVAVDTYVAPADTPPEPEPSGRPLPPAVASVGCAYGPGDRANKTLPAGTPTGDAIPIKYVFVLMMENRSFDSYFGRFPAYLNDSVGADPTSDVRLRPYRGRLFADGVDVPGTPYERLPKAARDAADASFVLNANTRDDAPFNPSIAGTAPTKASDKHYWRHADAPCVSDTAHEWWCVHLQWDMGKMDGFYQSNHNYFEGGEPYSGPPGDGRLDGERAMFYYDDRELPFYYWLADQFTLADGYYSSVLGPTFVNRDYLYGATSRGLTSNASDQWNASPVTGSPNVFAGKKAPNPKPPTLNGKDVNTVYDMFDAASPAVKYTQYVRKRYTDGVRAARWGSWYGGPSAVAPILTATTYSYDNASIFNKGLASYVASENSAIASAPDKNNLSGVIYKNLYPVNFIDPDALEDVNGEDEHPPGTPQMGQRFVYDVVRTLMKNPEVWKRSVLFITYDEHGGFYDHAPPPAACEPDNYAPQGTIDPVTGAFVPPTSWSGPYNLTTRAGENGPIDPKYGGAFNRLGVRVPLIVVSPWAKRHFVGHQTYDHASIVRFIETRFDLPALTRRDANADPMLGLFDFTDAAKKLSGGVAGWGSESLPASFPSHTETKDAASDISITRVSVPRSAIESYGGPDSERYKMKVPNDTWSFKGKSMTCLQAFPPAGISTPGTLSDKVYEEWSPGVVPPGWNADPKMSTWDGDELTRR